MTDTEKNMELWLDVCTTDETRTPIKDVKGKGYKCKSVDAQSLLKWATEIFGPYGVGFGIKDLEYTTYGKQHVTYGKKNPRKMIGPAEIAGTGNFWFYLDVERSGEFAISSSMIWDPAGDCQKKILTNMMSKALSKLGFNSDIYEKNFDDDVYAPGAVPTPAEMAAKKAAKAQAPAPTVPAQPGTPLPPQQPPVAPPPPVQTPPAHPLASLPPNPVPVTPDTGQDMLLVQDCKYELSRSSNRPQFAVSCFICDGAHKKKEFKTWFSLEIWDDIGKEPFPHHITRRWLTCLNLNIKEVQQNPNAFCDRIKEQYFKAKLVPDSYTSKKDGSQVETFDIDGLEIGSVYESPQAEQQTMPPPPGTAPPAAPPPPTPGTTGVPPPPGDVELDPDIDLEEDEDYLVS